MSEDEQMTRAILTMGTMGPLDTFTAYDRDTLKRCCDDLYKAMNQKTAGQYKDSKDIPFEALVRLQTAICIEAIILCSSGILDGLDLPDD